ncbi:MAG: LacI family DNA-binding transcriptional regulator [Phycisphaeraceae bacterium]
MTVLKPRNLVTRPANRRVTLADVASLAGCSTAIVSTVINRASSSAGASPNLIRRIKQAARELDYRPDFASQSLARRSTRTIGVYVPPETGSSLAYPYEAAIIRGIEQVCQQRNYDLLAINLTGKTTPQGCFHKFTERRIDGLVLLHVPDEADWVGALLERYPHVASVNYYGPVQRLLTVNFDDHAATALAVQHLVELGHTRIAYIGPASLNPGPGAVLRCQGFQDAMRAHGLPIVPQWIWDRSNPQAAMPTQGLDLFDSGEAAVDQLFSSSPSLAGSARPTALVCYGDLTAIRATRQLKKYGLTVPRDVSVVGIDDMELCRHVDPPLTSIRQPLEDMGRRITALLFDRKPGKKGLDPVSAGDEDPIAPPAPELVAPTLVVRESTARPSSPQATRPGSLQATTVHNAPVVGAALAPFDPEVLATPGRSTS